MARIVTTIMSSTRVNAENFLEEPFLNAFETREDMESIIGTDAFVRIFWGIEVPSEFYMEKKAESTYF